MTATSSTTNDDGYGGRYVLHDDYDTLLQVLRACVEAGDELAQAFEEAEPLVASAELIEDDVVPDLSRAWQRQWAAYRHPNGWTDQDSLPEPVLPRFRAALSLARPLLEEKDTDNATS